MKFPIYLDSHATTPVDPRVFEEMKPYFTEMFGNASSIDHLTGHTAADAVQMSREQISRAINADAHDIVFTSGATESDNLALKGVMDRNSEKGDHLITCVTEHHAILDVCRGLENVGKKVTYLSVDTNGMVDPQAINDAITNKTVMISIMAANNEIGTLADITKIGQIAHDNNVLFHTDAAQAVGHIPMDTQKMNIDLLSFSAHKIYGPKGVGALYVRGIRPRVKLNSIIEGGGQEKNIRSGTLNVPGIVGFAKAVEIARDEMEIDNVKSKKWTNKILEKLSDAGVILNGHLSKRLAHNLNVRFDGIDGKAIINSVSKKISISAGSACTTHTVEPSHVLLAIGLSEEQAHSSIRIGCNRFNTDIEIDTAADVIYESVKSLSKIRI